MFSTCFPFKLLESIEQSLVCYRVGPCWLSVLNIAVYSCQSKIPNLFLFSPLFSPGNHKFIILVCEFVSVL